MRIKIVLVTGLALIALAVLLVLLHSPSTVIATNGIAPNSLLGVAKEGIEACQKDETLPAGTSAIRLQVTATTGPRVSVQAFAAGHTLTHGTLGPAWYGSVATVPVAPLHSTVQHATVCFQLAALSGQVAVYGSPSSKALAATVDGHPMSGRFRVVYLAPTHESWWSRAGGVIKHMGLGRAASGTWIVLPIVLLALGAIAAGSSLLLRELR